MEYSIIIPHKNIPSLLQRCLDSIPSRDDLQIIVVDDNSNPEIVDFEHFPGSDRDDVKLVFTKEGKGAGYARNVGMKYAIGKWLLFADADDFFHDGMLEMLDKWKDSDYQIVFFKTDSADSETLESRSNRLPHIDYNDSNCLKYYYYVPWGRILLASFINDNGILFDETEVSNDVMFSLKSGHLANRISVSSDTLYCSTHRQDSLINTDGVERLKQRIAICYRYNDYCRENSINCSMISDAIHYIKRLQHLDKQEYYRQLLVFLWKAPLRRILLDKLKQHLAHHQ